MGWSIGYDENWKRDIGYGVPAYCDHPGCGEEINRGLSYVCGGEPYGGEHGCGLYFCSKHRQFREFNDGCCPHVCSRCQKGKPPFKAATEHPKWINFKLTDESWQRWRDENPEEVTRLRGAVTVPGDA
jgi:hypothetical protein